MVSIQPELGPDMRNAGDWDEASATPAENRRAGDPQPSRQFPGAASLFDEGMNIHDAECRPYRHSLSTQIVGRFDPQDFCGLQNVGMTNHQMIGRRIAKTRKAMGATQVEMAEAIGLSRPQLTGIEGGGTTSLPTIIAIADYLKVPLDWLLGRKVPPGGPLIGHFIYEPDQLALFSFWDALSIEERRAVFITLRISSISGTGT